RVPGDGQAAALADAVLDLPVRRERASAVSAPGLVERGAFVRASLLLRPLEVALVVPGQAPLAGGRDRQRVEAVARGQPVVVDGDGRREAAVREPPREAHVPRVRLPPPARARDIDLAARAHRDL